MFYQNKAQKKSRLRGPFERGFYAFGQDIESFIEVIIQNLQKLDSFTL